MFFLSECFLKNVNFPSNTKPIGLECPCLSC